MRLDKLPSTLTAALLAAVFPFLISACAKPQDARDETAEQTAAGEPEAGEVVTSTGLKYVDLEVGNGPEAQPGDTVDVHYTGRLVDGTKFDSSLDRQEPLTFRLGAGEVIEGWDQGIAGMKVGGKRKLTIPPELGYGDQGAQGVIPPGATLIFDVKLLKIQ
jgi:peptidylprolyl isomerase